MDITISWVILVAVFIVCQGETLPDGHMKPFGYGNAKPIKEVEGFLPVKEFFEGYARKKLPVVMRGATKVWPAFERWDTDKYFLSVAPTEEYMVALDRKRGDPNQPHTYVDFKEFIHIYNTSTRRMIERTPAFLLQDVLVPGPLQCDVITEGDFLMGHKMWFGNNYTTSQVHKDAADNINCLVKGVKNYTIIDPVYQRFVLFDHPGGLYSSMNVDEVDFKKYPGLDKVEYQIAELHAGDCIFVPYKWIHQVRSYGRNIAVNVWWNYWKNDEINLDNCPSQHDNSWTISKASYGGWGDFETRDAGVREHVEDLIVLNSKPVTWPRFITLYTFNDYDPLEEFAMLDKKSQHKLKESFDYLDADKDGSVSIDDITKLTDTEWKVITPNMKHILRVIREQADEYTKESREHPSEFEEYDEDEIQLPPIDGTKDEL